MLRVGAYAVDIRARQCLLRGKAMALSRREFDLALYLFQNVGRLIARNELEQAVWGRELGAESKTLDSHLYRLRIKLWLQPENGMRLASVYARGLRLVQVQAPEASAGVWRHVQERSMAGAGVG